MKSGPQDHQYSLGNADGSGGSWPRDEDRRDLLWHIVQIGPSESSLIPKEWRWFGVRGLRNQMIKSHKTFHGNLDVGARTSKTYGIPIGILMVLGPPETMIFHELSQEI